MAYNAVAPIVLETLETQVSAYWDYTVISTGMVIFSHLLFPTSLTGQSLGHSLGGAIASIASLSIKSTFPSVKVRLFTFGKVIRYMSQFFMIFTTRNRGPRSTENG